MPKGISVQEAGQRLGDAGLRNGDRYRRGVTGKGAKWAAGAGGAQSNYEAGVQASIAQKKYSRGVQNAGAGAYEHGVTTKGVNNWGTGLAAGQDKYVKNTQKFSSLWTSPLATPRGPRRSPTNLQRMSENVKRFIDTSSK